MVQASYSWMGHFLPFLATCTSSHLNCCYQLWRGRSCTSSLGSSGVVSPVQIAERVEGLSVAELARPSTRRLLSTTVGVSVVLVASLGIPATAGSRPARRLSVGPLSRQEIGSNGKMWVMTCPASTTTGCLSKIDLHAATRNPVTSGIACRHFEMKIADRSSS